MGFGILRNSESSMKFVLKVEEGLFIDVLIVLVDEGCSQSFAGGTESKAELNK